MAEGRMLRRKASVDERLAQLSYPSRDLYLLTLPHLDREGRVSGLPDVLRGIAVPALAAACPDDWTVPQVEGYMTEWLHTLDSSGEERPLVAWAAVGGIWVCEFLGFHQNQAASILRREPASIFPSPLAASVADPTTEYARVRARGQAFSSTDLGSDTPNEKIAATSSAARIFSSKKGRGRRRDPNFESLLEVCGIEAASLTASGRGAANRALRELNAVGATAEEIRRRSAIYRRRYSLPLTPSALAKHWGALAVEEPANARRGVSATAILAQAQEAATREALPR